MNFRKQVPSFVLLLSLCISPIASLNAIAQEVPPTELQDEEIPSIDSITPTTSAEAPVLEPESIPVDFSTVKSDNPTPPPKPKRGRQASRLFHI